MMQAGQGCDGVCTSGVTNTDWPTKKYPICLNENLEALPNLESQVAWLEVEHIVLTPSKISSQRKEKQLLG